MKRKQRPDFGLLLSASIKDLAIWLEGPAKNLTSTKAEKARQASFRLMNVLNEQAAAYEVRWEHHWQETMEMLIAAATDACRATHAKSVKRRRAALLKVRKWLQYAGDAALDGGLF